MAILLKRVPKYKINMQASIDLALKVHLFSLQSQLFDYDDDAESAATVFLNNVFDNNNYSMFVNTCNLIK